MLYGINKVFTNSYYKVTSYWDKDNDELNMSNKSYDSPINRIKLLKHERIVLIT